MTHPLLNAARRLIRENRLQTARELLEKAVDKTETGDIRHLLGLCLAKEGDLLKALSHLERAVFLQPGLYSAWLDLALCQERLGDRESARAGYQRAVEQNPCDPRGWAFLGDLERQMGEYEAAHRHLQKACELSAHDPFPWNLLAQLEREMGHMEVAETHWKEALSRTPDHLASLVNLGGLYLEENRLDDAEILLRRAVALAPDHSQARNNLGVLLRRKAHPEESLKYLQGALKYTPDDPDILLNLALTHHELGDQEGSLRILNRLIEDPSPRAEVRWARSITLLSMQNYRPGWKDYEAGLATRDRTPRQLPSRRWRGEPLSGKRLLLLAEQGIGDQIMFAGCLPDLLHIAQEEGGRIHVECDPRLAPLFSRSFPEITVHGVSPDTPWSGPDSPSDFTLPVGSLPLHFRNHINDFPGTAYLHPDPERVDFWRERYCHLGRGRVVGVSWRGGTPQNDQTKRSLDLSRWGPIFQIPGLHFVDLQYKGSVSERQKVQKLFGVPLHHWPDSDPFHQLDDLAAQLAACDLYVGVANATAHLAGALGVPSLILLPFVPSWRWGMEGDTTPWYASLRLFRQPRLRDWSPVIESISKALRDVVGQ